MGLELRYWMVAGTSAADLAADVHLRPLGCHSPWVLVDTITDVAAPQLVTDPPGPGEVRRGLVVGRFGAKVVRISCA